VRSWIRCPLRWKVQDQSYFRGYGPHPSRNWRFINLPPFFYSVSSICCLQKITSKFVCSIFWWRSFAGSTPPYFRPHLCLLIFSIVIMFFSWISYWFAQSSSNDWKWDHECVVHVCVLILSMIYVILLYTYDRTVNKIPHIQKAKAKRAHICIYFLLFSHSAAGREVNYFISTSFY